VRTTLEGSTATRRDRARSARRTRRDLELGRRCSCPRPRGSRNRTTVEVTDPCMSAPCGCASRPKRRRLPLVAVTLAPVTTEEGAAPSIAASAPVVPIVELDDVSVQFGGLSALSNVSFGVSSGEIVGLIGPNGAGKTTAFNVVCGFVKPTSGHVRFPGANRPKFRPRQLARAGISRSVRLAGLELPEAKRSSLRPSQLARAGVSRTLQGVGLFPRITVLENVMAGGHIRRHGGFFTSLFALPTGVRAECALRADALAELDRLGVASYATRYPGEIPYGVSKKVSVARALMCNPKLLLLDEPASGLDEAELDDFSRLIVRLRNDMGVLLVEHDMAFVMPLVDRLVVLDFGVVIAMGAPREVQSNPAVIEAYLGVQS
jgi:branched-chain amino acid transport system ATP-binding protein